MPPAFLTSHGLPFVIFSDTSVMSKCFQERQEARKVARRESSDVLIPSCNPDGTYSEVQCHKTTGYCWCVTKDGRHIPGTSIQERRPRCKGLVQN